MQILTQQVWVEPEVLSPKQAPEDADGAALWTILLSGELEFQLSVSLTWGDAGEVCLDGLSPLCS